EALPCPIVIGLFGVFLVWFARYARRHGWISANTPHARDRADRSAPGAEQRLHDVRLVRAPQGTRFEAVVRGRAGELGHRLLRVHAAGAGQPDRLWRDVARPAQDPAGSDHADGVRAVRGVLHEGTAEARLPVGGPVHARRGVLHLQGLGAGLTMAPCRRGAPSSTSVQAMCAALPRSTIFGKPVALPRPRSSATCRRWYSRCRSGLRRDSHSDWPLASSRIHSSQAWCASTATATRPSTGRPCSSTTGG